MTTYCPIIRRCVQHVKKGLLTPEEIDVSELEAAAAGASSHPALIGLRGFMAIDVMLEFIRQTYVYQYTTNLSPNLQLTLKIKSWGGLTDLKEELTKLADEVELELGEAKLEGHTVDDEGPIVVRAPREGDSEDQIRRGQRLSAAKRLLKAATSAQEAIAVLRPYLQNEDTSVTRVADSLAYILIDLYGGSPTGKLYETTMKMIEVQL